MTEEEYLKMRNLLDTVIEQQATFAENQRKADERQARTEEQIARNAEQIAQTTNGITALLAVAEMHEQEMTARFKETDDRFRETDDRINALINVVERYITKGE